MIRYFTALLLTLCLAPFAAAMENPDVLVKRIVDDVLATLKSDPQIQAGDRDRVIKLVDEKVLPQFNFERMTALAVGVNWRTATDDQKTKLVAEFRTLLVRTYSTALTQYHDQTLEFKPLNMKPDDTRVIVNSLLKQQGGQPLAIDYRMIKLPEGWKVYDVIVGGVSLVTTYRSTFAEEVRNNGLDGLVKMLAEKNQQLQSSKG